jgi:6-phosphogluconolactonase
MIPEGQLTVLPDAEALAERSAAWMLERVLMVAGPVSICLSGGSTPQRLYQTLARAPYRDRMPWQRIHWFWGDERFVPSNDARSNYRMVRDALLDRVAGPVGSVHPIPTDGATLDAAVVAYERELKQFYAAEELSPGRPLFDVTLLGLGEDGHTASLIPGAPALEERSRWAAAVVGVAPEARITLTYPALESSRDVAFLVSGAAKREILARIREGAADVPAARIRPVGRLHWFVDRAALPDQP